MSNNQLLKPILNKSEVKVLFFSYWYPNRHKNNAALFIKRHAHALAGIYQTEVLAVHIVKGKRFYYKDYVCEQDEANVKTHHLYLESKYYKWFYVFLPFQYFLLKKTIQQHIQPEFKFNIIHSNVIFPCGIIGYQLSKYFQCPHLITEHWSKIDKFFKRSLYKWMGKKALNNASAITCVSEQLQNNLQNYHRNQHHFIVANVVDSSAFFVDQRVQKHPEFTFTAVAHWHAPKNPFYFLEAIHVLQKEKALPRFKVILIGTGDLLEKVKAKKYDFTIETPGNLKPAALAKHLNQCHAFLHGSDFETFSVVIIEALLCGLPCLVSPVGVAKAVINDKNGLIANNTVADWKEKIKILLSSTYNAKLISDELGQKYSSKSVAKEFEKVYQSSLLIHD